MKPVDQTKFGAPEGNCFAACIATIFGLPLDAVPHFMADRDWWGAFRRWSLNELGHDVVMVKPDEEGNFLRDTMAPCIVSGPASRGLDHATVYYRGGPWHDPHPSRDYLIKANDVVFFVPMRNAVVRPESEATDAT